YLGPENFGLLSYAISFVGLFFTISTLGLNNIVIRELVKTPRKREEILGTTFVLKIFGTLLMWLCIAVVLFLIQIDKQSILLISIIALAAIFQTFNVIELNYQAEVKAKFITHAQFIEIIVSAIFKLLLILIGASLVWFAWAYVVNVFILAIGLLLVYSNKTGTIKKWYWNSNTAKNLLRNSWPMILSGVVISIYMKIDQVMIKEMLSAEEVGYYAAAVRLSEAWYFIPMTITTSLFPAIINARDEGLKAYSARLNNLYRLMFWMAITIAVPISFTSSFLINILFGEAYQPAALVLSIHIWAGIFVFLGVANGRRLLTENLQKYTMFNTSAGAVINVILNLILIKKYGITGAAISTIISYSYAAYFGLSLFNKTRQSFMDISSIFFGKSLTKI
ncbi:flippase, partial [Thermodesulfobacteriota bacterium]